MTPVLDRIRVHGGEAIRDGFALRVRRGKLNDDAMAWLRENRDRVMREVWPEFDDWSERAAIREYEGGQDRADAEADAYAEVMAR